MAKTTDNTKLKSWEEVDRELKELSKADANITYLKNRSDDIKRARGEREERIRAFVEDHLADLGEARKKLLPSGQVGMTQTTSVQVDDEEACLQYLQRNRLESCIKASFKVVKEALKALGDDVKAAAGVHLVTQSKLSLKPTPQAPTMHIKML